MAFQVENKVALVTGANRGIGKTILETLIDKGVSKVYAAVRTLESAQPLVETYGDKVQPLQVDVSDANSIKNLASQAKDVQLVVNNAGVLVGADPLSDNAEDALNFEFNINTLGLLRMARAFEPVLEANGGAFVQLNSVASIKNFTPLTTYSASKAAAYSLTQGLKDTFLPKGISVLSVHPGPIATDMGDSAGFSEIAEPTNVVAEGIVDALAEGQFHLFPDSMAKQVEGAYQSFAENIVEADLTES